MNKSKVFYIAIIITGLLLSCDKDSEDKGNDIIDFSHGSLRPDCLYEVDPGREAYYEEPIVLIDGWSNPVMLSEPVTDSCPNDAIEISRDGNTLYFFWSPTVGGTYAELLHIHTGTYYATKVGDDPGVFSEPRFYDLQKGAKDGSVDGVPSFTPDKDFVYFHSTRSDNLGYQQTPPVDDYLDIYKAPIINGEPGPAVNLGEPINSIYLDGEHSLSPDGSKLYITSDRPGGLGGPDIWVSENIDGVWSEPVNLEAPINSDSWDGQPGFAANEPNIMYFVSRRDGASSIYRSIYNGTNWSEPEMIITGYVGEPSLTADGKLLYFVHVLVDDEGVFGSNIWYIKKLD